MSFQATLEISGKKYTLLNFEMQIHKPVNINGEPIGVPKLAAISLVVKCDKGNDFFEWLLTNSQKNGEIIFDQTSSASTLQKLNFKSAYCVSYRQVYNSDNQPTTWIQEKGRGGEYASQLLIHLKISAHEISIDSQTHVSEWIIAAGEGGAGTRPSGAPDDQTEVNPFIAD